MILDQYQEWKQALEADLVKIEKTLGDMEQNYLGAEYSQCGTVLKGFDGFLSSKDVLRKKTRSFKPEDRLFSLSSKTSAVTREIEQPAMEAMDSLPPLVFKKSYAQKGFAQKGKR